MAAVPPLVYDPDHSATAEYYTPYTAADVYHTPAEPLYYATPGVSSAGSYPGAHEASAIAVLNNQGPTSHQYYGDARPAVIPYCSDYTAQSGDAWLQRKNAPSEDPQTYCLDNSQQQILYYESGEVSPVSDDSGGTFYDSPERSDDAQLVDDHHYGSHDHGCDQAYYGQAATAVAQAQGYSHEHFPCGEQGASRHSFTRDFDRTSPVHSRHTHPAEYDEPQSPVAYCVEGVDGGRSASHPQDASSGDYSQHYTPATYVDASRQQYTVPLQSVYPTARTESPMGHLPYQDVDPYKQHYSYTGSRSPSSSTDYSSTYSQHDRQTLIQPEPRHHYQHTYPQSITIPAPRSPPLIEDTPKKPLTLACFFCRKRKIACGSPSPGAKDRTCK
ncbi:hypothetical protein PHLCEN_2v11517 [Hermanssonia centrifuga]|uniref:Uncharacterized protein n=1 Tax=Hermanssonia centrifuga TaxID=98765 RepID=A0A2R6NJU7_9APHY|nr:hypothetical protein PHLCEN_2v11517 [Hermanssonia centrifuga]